MYSALCRNAPVPEPPAGHRWKEVRHDSAVTWLACWTENIQGSTKYVMLNAASKLKVGTPTSPCHGLCSLKRVHFLHIYMELQVAVGCLQEGPHIVPFVLSPYYVYITHNPLFCLNYPQSPVLSALPTIPCCVCITHNPLFCLHYPQSPVLSALPGGEGLEQVRDSTESAPLCGQDPRSVPR